MKRLRSLVISLSAITLSSCGGAANVTPSANQFDATTRSTQTADAGPLARESVLYTFGGSPDASGPFGGLLAGKHGEFFGISNGGGSGNGTVYEVSAKGKEQVLYDFQGGSDGSGSEAALIADSAGNMFGVNDYGGGSGGCTYGCGTVFEIQRSGSGYNERVLYAFQGGQDGASPLAALVIGNNGTLYGTTFFGGTGTCSAPSGSSGCGTVFSLTPSGSHYTEKVLHSFQGGRDGEQPGATLSVDASGNLYGTTEFGGNSSSACRTSPAGSATCGTVFEVTQSGKEKILYRFNGGKRDGSSPRGGVRLLSNGSFIGVTLDGGALHGGIGGGSVFELTPNGHRYSERIVHFFARHHADGVRPGDTDGLAMDGKGNLYGTTVSSNLSCGCGTVFQLTPTPSSYSEKVLYFFGAPGDGAFPHSSVIVHRDMIYGTTFNGGNYCYGSSYSCGTVFKVR